jgi:hypothetical protein
MWIIVQYTRMTTGHGESETVISEIVGNYYFKSKEDAEEFISTQSHPYMLTLICLQPR